MNEQDGKAGPEQSGSGIFTARVDIKLLDDGYALKNTRLCRKLGFNGKKYFQIHKNCNFDFPKTHATLLAMVTEMEQKQKTSNNLKHCQIASSHEPVTVIPKKMCV